jgi:hypothetical protein
MMKKRWLGWRLDCCVGLERLILGPVTPRWGIGLEIGQRFGFKTDRTAPEGKMQRVASGKIYALAKELESMGIKALVLKTNSQYHVTLVTDYSSVTFSGTAWQIERLIKAFKLGYEWGWRARGDHDAAPSHHEENARDS